MRSMDRRSFLKQASTQVAGVYGAIAIASTAAESEGRPAVRPNILFALADDWSWPHASIYGCRAVQTPAFDRIAREGCLFTNAFVAAPQCSPNRAAVLTGRPIWQLEEAGTHASIFPGKFAVYPSILEAAGYHVGYTGKGWAPGDWARGGWSRNPAGAEYNQVKRESAPTSGISTVDYAANFEAFLEARKDGVPFCFWYGPSEPHRRYEAGSGMRAGKKLEDAPVPPFAPDDPQVRSDLLDYLLEVEWLDAQLGLMLARLEALGELDNTLVVVSGDNGMSWPAAKATLYEYGLHVPLAIRWPEKVRQGQTSEALVSFIDLAPTFLEAAGAPVPAAMTGKSLLGLLSGEDPNAQDWNYVLAGRERHSHARYDNLGYPSRALRTRDRLYIRNFAPDRWPAGDPEAYYDVDDSPTKTLILEQRNTYPELYALAFGKRPEEQLYDIVNDPGCLHNLASEPGHAVECQTLRERLMAFLEAQADPRALGTGAIFESYPRVSAMRPELGGFCEQHAYNPKYQPRPGQFPSRNE